MPCYLSEGQSYWHAPSAFGQHDCPQTKNKAYIKSLIYLLTGIIPSFVLSKHAFSRYANVNHVTIT